MCQFGNESLILEEKDIPKDTPILGWRIWRVSIKDKDVSLISFNQDYHWPLLAKGTGLERDNSLGIYSYNNNYNNYYYNYNHYGYNNYNYNNYNNNYNYNYNNYYYNYNYNYNNYYYYMIGECLSYGKTFIYRGGYRSEYSIPKSIRYLEDNRWFDNNETKDFALHFNSRVDLLVVKYNLTRITEQEMNDKWLKQI